MRVRATWVCSACRRADLGKPSTSLPDHTGRMSERQSQASHRYKERQFYYCGSEAVDQVEQKGSAVFILERLQDLSGKRPEQPGLISFDSVLSQRLDKTAPHVPSNPNFSVIVGVKMTLELKKKLQGQQ